MVNFSPASTGKGNRDRFPDMEESVLKRQLVYSLQSLRVVFFLNLGCMGVLPNRV